MTAGPDRSGIEKAFEDDERGNKQAEREGRRIGERVEGREGRGEARRGEARGGEGRGGDLRRRADAAAETFHGRV